MNIPEQNAAAAIHCPEILDRLAELNFLASRNQRLKRGQKAHRIVLDDDDEGWVLAARREIARELFTEWAEEFRCYLTALASEK